MSGPTQRSLFQDGVENMWFPTKSAMDRAMLLRILEDHDAASAAKGGPIGDAAELQSRPNLGMVYSMLTDCHRQAVTVSRGVWALVAISVFVAFRLAT